MKKTYQAPKTNIVMLKIRHQLLSGSTNASGLDGFGGYGGGKSGGSADSRGGSFWDDDEE